MEKSKFFWDLAFSVLRRHLGLFFAYVFFGFGEKHIFVSSDNSLKSKGLIVVNVRFSMIGTNNLGLSRMEMYLAVIKVLDKGNSKAQQQIMRKAGINLSVSKEFFNFLIRLGIIREQTLDPEKCILSP